TAFMTGTNQSCELCVVLSCASRTDLSVGGTCSLALDRVDTRISAATSVGFIVGFIRLLSPKGCGVFSISRLSHRQQKTAGERFSPAASGGEMVRTRCERPTFRCAGSEFP